MRKHFLILMLLTLLPFTAWAATDPVAPVAKTDLVYSSGAQTLVTPGVAAPSKRYYYAVVEHDAAAPAWGAYGDADDLTDIKGTNAGSYDVYYVESAAAPAAAADVTGATKITVTIAKKDAVFPINATVLLDDLKHKTYGWKPTDFTSTELNLLKGAPEVGQFFNGDEDDVVILPNWGSVNAKGYYNAGPQTVTLSANAMDNYNVILSPSSASWYVDKKDLTITAENVNLTYGDEFVGTNEVTYNGFVANENEDDLAGTLSWSTNYTATSPVSGSPYSWQPAGLTSNNYNITFNNGNIIVGKKLLTPDMIAAMTAATYDGDNHKPTLTVADGELLNVATDIDVAWSYLSFVPEAVAAPVTYDAVGAFINAGTYTVTVTAQADGNYKTPAGNVEEPAATKTYTINRKDIQLRTLGDEMIYSKKPYVTGTGAYTLSFENHVQWSGVPAADIATETSGSEIKGNLKYDILNGATIALSLYDGTTAAAEVVSAGDILNAGTYNVRAAVSNGNKIQNYNIVVGNIGKIIVAKKQVSITPKSKTVPYGTKDEFKTATKQTTAANLWIGTTVKNDAGEITGVTDGTGLVDGDEFATIFADAANQITLQREAGNDAGPYALTAVVPAVTFDNYVFTVAEAGVYTISAIGGVQIWAEDANSFYKAGQADLSAIIIGVEDGDITTDIQNAVNQSLYVDFGEGKTATTAAAGTYPVKIDETKLNTALASLSNYDLTNVAKYNGTYTVKRVVLHVKAKDQVRQVGETVAAASDNTIAFVEDITVDAAEKTAIYNTLALQFTANVTNVDGDKKLTADALVHGYDADAIPTDTEDGIYKACVAIDGATVTTYNTAQNNYTLAIAAEGANGTLTVYTDAVFALDATNAETGDGSNTAKINAVVGQKRNVAISGRTLQANKWNALSLPFSISVRDLSKTLGYAIVDRFQQTGDKLNFKIYIGEIPAYTPFLVKVDEDVNLAEKIFTKVVVETPVTVTEENDTWKFINTIDDATVSGLVYYIKPSDSENSVTLGRRSSGAEFTGFYAYFKTQTGQPVADARIYIEEPDGSTTAISAIDADGVAVPAQGWYTINGMKLESMPTEKGVYINNGKKIVVK